MPRGIITFVFDDGYEQVYRNVLPALEKHNFPAVFAIPLNPKVIPSTEKRPAVPWQTWKEVEQQGHEIAAHSITHRNLTLLSDNELRAELEEPARKLQATTIVYPGGAHNDHVVMQASSYYTAGRTVLHGFETLPPQNPMKLRTYNFHQHNFSVWKANALAVWAVLTGAWLIETFHMIDDQEKEMKHTVPMQAFARHLAFVKALGITVQTVRQVVGNKQ